MAASGARAGIARIAPVYNRTDEAKLLPLRRIDMDRDKSPGVALASPVRFTPTFLIVDIWPRDRPHHRLHERRIFLEPAREVCCRTDQLTAQRQSFLILFKHSRDTHAAMASIIPSELEDELRDGAEYSPELDQLMRKARKASNFLKAISHENRLLLLCLLAERERSVSELENILSLRQSAVSQQLARLRYDGMVETRRDGKTIYYSLANDDVRSVISVIYDIFCATPAPTKKK